MKLVTDIRLYKSPYTLCYVSRDSFTLPSQETYKSLGLKQETHCEGQFVDNETTLKSKRLKLVVNALFLRPFMLELKNSTIYRKNVLSNINQMTGNSMDRTVMLHLILEPPDQEVIDFLWNDKIMRLVWMRIEIENAFSWLSTLGGAYSALGDYFTYCADHAAKISRQQYQLSKMLGDDSLAERSKLYLAIAFAQKGDLKRSRHITRNVCEFSILNKDKRLNRMCQGVWAKLKYLRSIKNEEKLKITNIQCDTQNGKIVSEDVI